MLGKVADGQMFTGLELAGDQRQGAGQGLDQGGLASAVGPQYADPCPGGQTQFHLFQHRLALVTQGATGQVEQRVGLVVGLAETEAEGRVDMGRAEQFHALQGLESALGLARLGRLGAEPGNVLLHVLALGLLLLVGGLLLAQAFGTGPFELAVTATVEGQLL